MSNAALEALIQKHGAARAAGAPMVNPTPAAQVLATQTHAEVNQTAAPQTQTASVSTAAAPAATSAATAETAPPAAASAATSETAGKQRRTAAVVQAELDAANATIEMLRAQLAAAAANGGVAMPGALATVELSELLHEVGRRGFGVYSVPGPRS